MQDTLNGVRLVHGAEPRAKACVRETITEAAYRIRHNERRVRWVRCENSVRHDVTQRRHDADAAPAQGDVDARIGKCRERVAYKGREEDERYHGVVQVVVVFELPAISVMS